MNLSLIIPTYNEHENIKELIDKIKINLSQKDLNYKIFIIDDSSTKKTFDNLKDDINNIDYIFRGKKLGRGSAVLEGIKLALKSKYTDTIIEMDADLSHDPNEIFSNLKIFKEQDCDLLIASRYLSKSKIVNWPISRIVLSFIANKLAKFFLKIPVSDYTNGFRFYSKNAAEHVVLNCGKIGDGFIVLSEILLALHLNKFKIAETSTIFRNRIRGDSSVNFKLVIKSLIGLHKLYLIKNKKNVSNNK